MQVISVENLTPIAEQQENIKNWRNLRGEEQQSGRIRRAFDGAGPLEVFES